MLSVRGMFRGALVVGMAALALGVGGATNASAATRVVKDDRPDISVSIQAAPAASANTLNYTITTLNTGKSPAKNATITLPFDTSKLRLDNVQFSRPGAWVSANGTDSVEIQTGRVNSGDDSVTATLFFTKLANDAAVTQQASYKWTGVFRGSGEGHSNTPVVSNDNLLNVAAINTPERQSYSFKSAIFVPGEAVVLWYNTPDGRAEQLEVKENRLREADLTKPGSDEEGSDYTLADDSGAIDLEMLTRGMAPGTYSIIARGAESGLSATGTFVVR